MSMKITKNTLYIKQNGKLIPIAMFGSGAEASLTEIRRVCSDQLSIINYIKDDIDSNVRFVMSSAKTAENALVTIEESNEQAKQYLDDAKTELNEAHQQLTIANGKAAFAFVEIEGYTSENVPDVSNPLESVIYMVKNNSVDPTNQYDKWMWYKDHWEKIGFNDNYLDAIIQDSLNTYNEEVTALIDSKIEQAVGTELDNKLLDLQNKTDEMETKLQEVIDHYNAITNGDDISY